MPDISVEWVASYVLGLAAIALFARERLNRLQEAPEASHRGRLLAMLLPGQMRNRWVFRRGVAFYFLALTAIYSVFALFASYLLPLLGGSIGVALSPDDPVFPVAVALTLVGFLPEFGPFARLETKARGFALWLVGIPETFHDFCDRLRDVQIAPDDIPDNLLDPVDAEKLRGLLARAEDALGSGNEYRALEQCAIKLWCFREWTEDKTAWPPTNIRVEFDAIEQHVKPSALAVIEDLENLPRGAPAQDGGALSTFRSRWKSVAERAARATDDICALFALYAERATDKPERDNPISAVLRTLIDAARKSRERRPSTADTVILILAAVAVTAFGIGFWGAGWGPLLLRDPAAPPSGPDQFLAILDFVTRMAILLSPATIFAVLARRRRWMNLFDVAAPPTRQYAWLALRAGTVSLLLMVLYTFYVQLSIHMDLHPEEGRMGCVLWQYAGVVPGSLRAHCLDLLDFDPGAQMAAFWYAMPDFVISGVLAVMFALVLDSLTARRPRPKAAALLIAAAAAATAGLSVLAARFLDILAHDPGGVAFQSLSIAALTVLVIALTARYVPPHWAPPVPA